MAQTSAAKGIESGKVHTSDGVLLTDTIIKHFLENDVPVPSEKPLGEGIGFDDPASWVLPSRFGLGVLSLIRGCSTIKHSLENDVPAPPKKPRREGMAFDNAASWVLPGELSRLNLDVLFLVRGCSSLFSDRSLTGAMVLDCLIHPPFGPPESYTHM